MHQDGADAASMRRRITVVFALAALGLVGCADERMTGVATPRAERVAAQALLISGPRTTVLSDGFDGAGLDGSKWFVRADIPAGNASVTQSGSSVFLSNRAHLVTQQEWIPSIEALRISGQLTWTGTGGDDFIQILTRSEGVPLVNGAGETNSGVQAYACSQEIIQCANVMEIKGPEVFDVASTGSVALIPGTVYNFEVTDDGLAVSFTLENATTHESRTITARSTYKPSINHVVFHNREACCGGEHVLRLDNVLIERVERAPSNVVISGISQIDEGSSATFSATATDRDTPGMTFQWTFNGVTGESGGSIVHAFANNKAGGGPMSYSVTAGGGPGGNTTATGSILVRNVAPSVAALTSSIIFIGETYKANGSFTDPGADAWSATVNYGGGTSALALTGKTFQLSHLYDTAGQAIVEVRVSDADGGVGSAVTTVLVLTAAQAVNVLKAAVDALIADGTLTEREAGPMLQLIYNGNVSYQVSNFTAGSRQLEAAQKQVSNFLRSGKISQATANALNALIARIIAAAGVSDLSRK